MPAPSSPDNANFKTLLDHYIQKEQQLRRKEEQLRREKEQLRRKEEQLREEKLIMLRARGKFVGWFFASVFCALNFVALTGLSPDGEQSPPERRRAAFLLVLDLRSRCSPRVAFGLYASVNGSLGWLGCGPATACCCDCGSSRTSRSRCI